MCANCEFLSLGTLKDFGLGHGWMLWIGMQRHLPSTKLFFLLILKCLRLIFCLFLKFGQAIVVRIFCIMRPFHNEHENVIYATVIYEKRL